jgi:hypothetical protein
MKNADQIFAKAVKQANKVKKGVQESSMAVGILRDEAESLADMILEMQKHMDEQYCVFYYP